MEIKAEKEVQDQMVIFMLMDLVDHELLTAQEAELARRIYLKKKAQKENLTESNRCNRENRL